MSEEFPLEDGIPLPTTHARNNKYPWHHMEIGQSFFVSNIRPQVIASRASVAGKKLGKKFATRKAVESDGREGTRVWRMPDPGTAQQALPSPTTNTTVPPLPPHGHTQHA